jgi:Zn-dependent peptidase ImmA (M78 family)
MITDLLRGNVTQQDLLNYYNANITYVSLGSGINGFVFAYRDVYNIIINSNLSYYKKKKTILHELAHIELCHLNQINKDMFAFYVDKYEDEASKYIKFIENSIKSDIQ